MLKFIGNDETHDYYITSTLNSNYIDIIRFKKKKSKRSKLDTSIKSILQLTSKEYNILSEKYSGYTPMPFMYNDLFAYAYNNDRVRKDMPIKYMCVYKLDTTNYIVKERNGQYKHIILVKGEIVFEKKLNCKNCNVFGDIIICDNKLYNFRNKTFSLKYDEISLFDVRKVNDKYVECALATMIVNCDFKDVEANEELSFYIDTKGRPISNVETSIGTFKPKTCNELQIVRNKVYASLRKLNFAHRHYLKQKKMK